MSRKKQNVKEHPAPISYCFAAWVRLGVGLHLSAVIGLSLWHHLAVHSRDFTYAKYHPLPLATLPHLPHALVRVYCAPSGSIGLIGDNNDSHLLSVSQQPTTDLSSLYLPPSPPKTSKPQYLLPSPAHPLSFSFKQATTPAPLSPPSSPPFPHQACQSTCALRPHRCEKNASSISSADACCWCACCSFCSAKLVATPTVPKALGGAAGRGRAELADWGLL